MVCPPQGDYAEKTHQDDKGGSNQKRKGGGEMKVLAKHKWVGGATITESHDEVKELRRNTTYRRFTATIRGWQNFKIYEGPLSENIAEKIRDTVIEIRNAIDAGDEGVFDHKGYWL